MKKIFLFSLLLPLSLLAQNKARTISQIYSMVILKMFSERPGTIAIDKTTNNTEISKLNFNDVALFLTNKRLGTPVSGLDSSWIDVLTKADKKKQELTSYDITNFKVPGFVMLMVRTDSAVHLGNDPEGYDASGPAPPPQKYWINSRIKLSGIIFFKKRAIVGFNRFSGLLDGESSIFFLEKKKANGKKQWKVVGSLLLWIS